MTRRRACERRHVSLDRADRAGIVLGFELTAAQAAQLFFQLDDRAQAERFAVVGQLRSSGESCAPWGLGPRQIGPVQFARRLPARPQRPPQLPPAPSPTVMCRRRQWVVRVFGSWSIRLVVRPAAPLGSSRRAYSLASFILIGPARRVKSPRASEAAGSIFYPPGPRLGVSSGRPPRTVSGRAAAAGTPFAGCPALLGRLPEGQALRRGHLAPAVPGVAVVLKSSATETAAAPGGKLTPGGSPADLGY